MPLNPVNFSFRVYVGKFLGFMVTRRGIKANLDKFQVVITRRRPTKVKEVQHITSSFFTQYRFLSCAGNKAFLFFTALKKKERFERTPEREQAFTKVKNFLTFLPILSRLKDGLSLLLYLSVIDQVISSVLVQEIDKAEKHVYFISKVYCPKSIGVCVFP